MCASKISVIKDCVISITNVSRRIRKSIILAQDLPKLKTSSGNMHIRVTSENEL